MGQIPSPEMKPDSAERRLAAVDAGTPEPRPPNHGEADGAPGKPSLSTHKFVADLSLTLEDGRRLLDYFISQGAAEAASELAAQLALHAHGASDWSHLELSPPDPPQCTRIATDSEAPKNAS